MNGQFCRILLWYSYLGLGGLGDGGGDGEGGGDGDGGFGEGEGGCGVDGGSGGGELVAVKAGVGGDGEGFIGGGESSCFKARRELDPASDCGISKI